MDKQALAVQQARAIDRINVFVAQASEFIDCEVFDLHMIKDSRFYELANEIIKHAAECSQVSSERKKREPSEKESA